MAKSPSSKDPAQTAAVDPAATPRKVYESTLLPARRRRLLPPAVALPGLLALIVIALFVLYRISTARRQVDTVGNVVYSVAPSGLYIIKTDGATPVPLATLGAGPTEPAFSPDGNQIAYLASQSGAQHDVFIMDGDGKNAQAATRAGLSKELPAFAPSDKTVVRLLGGIIQRHNNLLAYLSGGTLYTTDLSGNTSPIIPMPGRGPSQNVDAALLDTKTSVESYAWMPVADPDKQGLAAVLDVNGEKSLAIVPTPMSDPIMTLGGDPKGPPIIVGDSLSCAWNADGSALAVAAMGVPAPGGKPVSGLFFFNVKGQPVARPILFPPTHALGPAAPLFSPDGSRLIFQVWSQPDLSHRLQLGLFIAPADGSAPPQGLIRGRAEDAAFDATGTNLYFLTTRRDGGHDLMRVGTSGGSLQRLTDGVQDVTAFTLSPQTAPPKS